MADIDHHPGLMDINEQRMTFSAFLKLAKWGSLAIAVMVLFLAIWFCTDAGFFSALIAGVIVLAVGIFVLREKKGPVLPH